MTMIQLTGRITEEGELECKLPEGLPAGEARITIEVPLDEHPWTPEELETILRVEPMTGAEMIRAGVVGGWADGGIADGQEWVE